MPNKLETEQIDMLEEKSEEILLAVSNLYFSIASVNLDTAQIFYIKRSGDFEEESIQTGDYTKVLHLIGNTFFHPEDREKLYEDFSLEKLRERNQNGVERYYQEYRRKINKEWRWISCTAFCPEKNAARQRVTIVLQDVHEQVVKRKEEREEAIIKEENTKELLREALNHAKQASEAKSDFLSRMSHDLRTPMNAIIGMTALAQEHINDPDGMRECLRKISISGQHMMEIINEILNMSKIESGKVSLEEEEFKLSDLLESTLAIIRPMAEAKKQHIRVNVLNIIHETIYGDRTKLQQIFSNLLSNAYKYTQEGGTIKLVIEELSADLKTSGSYRFVFQDNGIGMSKEYLEHIFEPFTRAADARINKTDGTGLGMAITWNLVKMMGGDISVESKLNEGSTFAITLPLKQKQQEEMPCLDWSGKPVLVVEDDADGRKNMEAILKGFGMQVEVAKSVEDALYRIHKLCWNKEHYYAVLVDRTLQGIDGVEMAKKIRGIAGTENTAVLLCSYDCSSIKKQAQEAGVDALLTKPLFRSQVAAVLKTIRQCESFGWLNEESQEQRCLKGKRILLAEDNELNLEIACALLKTFGVCIDTAENGKEAVALFEQSSPGYYDLIFMDIQMPVMNGYEAAKAIRHLPHADAKTIPVVAMTADAFSEDVQKALNAGMNEHISKPISRESIGRIIRNWLK